MTTLGTGTLGSGTLGDPSFYRGKRPCQVCRVAYDRCTLTYGVAPCTAAIGFTGDAPCFNGAATCQDPDNISLADAWVTVSTEAAPGVHVSGEPAAFPGLTSVDIAATRLRPGQNLGDRGVLSVTIQDMPYHDAGFDPYRDTRGVDYMDGEHGTFWQRFLARFPYFEKRKIEIYSGWLDDTTGQWDYPIADKRVYLMESIAGPGQDATVSIQAKDPLKMADERSAIVPTPSTGVLGADMTTGATTLTLADATQVAQYQAAWDAGQKWLRIGAEIMEMTGRPAGVTFGVDRQQGPPRYDDNDLVLEEHRSGDTVQVCAWISGRIDEVCRYLLETVSGVPTAYLDIAGWDTLCDVWCSDWDFSALITEPTSAKQLLNEICAHSAYLWWDDRLALVRFDILRPQPNADVYTLNDEDNILAGSVQTARDSSQRISQVWIYYGQRNPGEKLDAPGNFAVVDVDVATDEEAAYQAKSVRMIRSRWLTKTARPVVATIGGRLIDFYKDTKQIVALTVDAKDLDKVPTGADVDLLTRYVRDATGNKLLYRFLVTEAKAIFSPSGGGGVSQVSIRCEAKTDPTASRTFLWAPDDNPEAGGAMPDYSDASETLGWTYGWFSPGDGPLLPYVWA